MQQLHWAELPTAALAQLTQNIHTDGKPPPLHEFCFFRQQQPGDRPPVEAGAAMIALISRKQFPGFALAFYDPLLSAGQGAAPPQRLALVADDAILLAPEPIAGGWRGFLIAEGTATGQTRVFHWPGQPDQPACCLAVPAPVSGATGAVWAEEAASLSIPPSLCTPDSPGSQPL
jgi:hypothetical protein